jgi:hypothetical protein
MRTKIAMLLLGLASSGFCSSQACAQVISGKVVSDRGESIKGVEVYGTKLRCCPAAVKSTTTKADGTFSFSEPGVVLHFRRSGLQPLSLVIGKNVPLAVVMKNQQPTLWTISACGPKDPLRFGQTFLFLRPTEESLAGGHDIDYTRFGVKRPGGASLDSWFGPTAADVDASEDFYLKSESFSERFVEVSGFGLVGIDARGKSKDGRHWRWVGLHYAFGKDRKSLIGSVWHWPRMVATDMIRYDNATDNEANEFNKIVDSVCLRPIPIAWSR